MDEIKHFILSSSADPKKFGLMVQGVVITFVGSPMVFALFQYVFAQFFGVVLNAEVLQNVAQQLGVLSSEIMAMVGSMVIVVGVCRKLLVRFNDYLVRRKA
jgi:hypothetical protein